MSEVYLAEDASLSRTVALKFLLPNLASDPDFRRRFEQEATGMASVGHPNVAVIYEIGAHHGRPFFAMEYVEGRTVQDVMADAPLTIEYAVDVAAQICDGLAAIHGKNLIHRDIKPTNILIDNADRVHILDFGIAISTDKVETTGSKILAGTPSYMSPEQIRGEPMTPAADLFSLGIILYQMLTGCKPFAGAYAASLEYAIVNDIPAPIENLRPDVPPAVAKVAARLLEKKPEDRYGDAREVSTRLRDVITGGDHGASQKISPQPGRRMPFVLISTVAALAVIVVIVLLYPWPGRRSPAAPTTLAVLPFDNLGSDEDEYFAEGITDAIITRLATVQNLQVISRRSSVLYKGSDLGYREIGAELGAKYLLTGTIFWDKAPEPDQIRINTQLVKAADESYVWGNAYERTRENIITLQTDIAEQVTSVLKIALSEEDRRSIMAVPTGDLEAYDYFLRGSHYFNRSWDQSDIFNATEMFQRAIDLDSGFALAYAMLARGHESMYWEYFDRSEDRCTRARQAAQKSLALQPGLVEGHLALGYIYYHCEQNYNRALEEFTSALIGRTDCSDLYSAVAAVQRRQGKLDEAVGNFVTALELDPRSHLKAFDVALTYGLMRRFDETMQYLDKTLALAPDWPLPYVYKAWNHIFYSGDTASARAVLDQAAGRADIASSRYYWWLSRIIEPDLQACLDKSRLDGDTADFLLHFARINRLLGRTDEERRYADSARTILEDKIQRQPDDPRFHSQLGLAYAGLRRKPEALSYGEKAIELLPTSRDAFDPLFFMINLAETFVIFGDYDAAIDQLERLISIPGFVSGPYLRLDPLWTPLRSLPRFQNLMVKT